MHIVGTSCGFHHRRTELKHSRLNYYFKLCDLYGCLNFKLVPMGRDVFIVSEQNDMANKSNDNQTAPM